MKIKILKQTFVKGQLAKTGDVINASEEDANLLIGMRKAIASTKSISAEDVKKPENKAVKKKSIFSRKKKQELVMITNYKDWYKLAKANPKVSIGIAIAIIILLSIIF